MSSPAPHRTCTASPRGNGYQQPHAQVPSEAQGGCMMHSGLDRREKAERLAQPHLSSGAPITSGGCGSLLPALRSGIPRGWIGVSAQGRIHTRARPAPRSRLPGAAGSGTAPTGSAHAHTRHRCPTPEGRHFMERLPPTGTALPLLLLLGVDQTPKLLPAVTLTDLGPGSCQRWEQCEFHTW